MPHHRSRSLRARLAPVVIAVVLVAGACARKATAPPQDTPAAPAVAAGSGFLDDYARLAPGTAEQPTLIYRAPDARWDGYDRILFEPVAIWRSGASSLTDVPQADLERLAWTLQHSVAGRLAQRFGLVDQPGPGVLRVRLALTDARQDDAVLDVFTWAVPPKVQAGAGDALAPATQRFLEAAAIEGEVSDSTTGTVLAAGVDRRRNQPITTWSALEAASQRWATWFAERLARAGAGAGAPSR